MDDDKNSWLKRLANNAARFRARDLFQFVPFIGNLPLSKGVPWRKAGAETALSILLSSVSIWIGVAALRFSNLESGVWSAANRVVSHGELYILASGAVSPLFYITLIRYPPDADKHRITSFPHGISYIGSAVVILAIAVVYIAIRSIIEHPGVKANLSMNNFIGFSWFLYMFSILLFFTASVHRYILEDTSPQLLKQDERDFEKLFMSERDA